ncbi:palm2 and akap2 fusion isoform X2 [Amia ocellicauda]|uniref:palm2 and akap2 fusion isoform X2 n=1 Tax=Amia ocellicauda TaxID=2972642 RepID=UPI003464628F
MGTPLRRKPQALEMAEAELHKERLQALSEKRKRQAEIEDKRRQLEDLILQLQHLKSKAMRERWLLQGTPVATKEEEEARRRQTEEDELKVKKLEDNIHRLETEIDQLESEESQISAKEQVLREKLRETEKSIEDLQKSLLKQDGDVVNYIYSQIPDLPELYTQRSEVASGDERLQRKAAIYAMEINVEKDKQTGATKILSASTVSPEDVHQRGVKVYDDGRKVVYEVRSGGTTTLENGVHPWSSSEVDELMQRVGQSQTKGDSGRVVVSPRDMATAGSGNLVTKEQMVHKEAKLEMVRNPGGKGTAGQPKYSYDEVIEVPEATSDKPVTMIFMGYHNVEDEEETKKLLGFDGTIKAEIVLIDEDDEKSLREKTVTDISTMDGNAADLVSGRPLSDTTELSSEGKDESSTKEPPPAGSGTVSLEVMTTEEEPPACIPPKVLHTALKSSSKIPEDDSQLKKERTLKSVSFLDPVSVISGSKCKMELESPFSEPQPENQRNCNGQNSMKTRHESLDSDVAKEIQYLDEVLEANCCDSVAESTLNGTSSPEPNAINIEGSGPSVHVSGESSQLNNEVIVVERKQTPVIENQVSTQVKPNGHSGMDEKDDMRLPGESTLTTLKKEARFELRAFQEEKKPSKLFDSSSEKEIVRVRKIRPSEEVAELERERRELIRSQAVKKNPGIAAKWWNPPQEKTIVEQLDPEQLKSHKKYEERKQKKPEPASAPQTSPKQTAAPFLPPELMNVQKEDIVTEQIDFSSARKQFLLMENSKHPAGTKRSVAPKLYSAKPFTKAPEVTHVERGSSSVTVQSLLSSQGQEEFNEVTTVKAEKIYCIPDHDTDVKVSSTQQAKDSTADHEEKEASKVWMDDGDFTCARAVMTILKDEDPDIYPLSRSVNVSYHPEEIDSGLDDLSLRSQDTTVLETLSNDFSMDNVSDSGASNETMNAFMENSLGDFSFPPTPQATTPIDGKMGTKSPSEHSISPIQSSYQGGILTEEQLEYHAGILVQNAIQQAIAQQSDEWDVQRLSSRQSHSLERHVEVTVPQQEQEKAKFEPPQVSSPIQEIKDIEQPQVVSPMQEKTDTEPPQVSSPVQEERDIRPPQTPSPVLKKREMAPKITVETTMDPEDTFQPLTIGSSQSPPPNDRQEFSYFSKYSQAAELRSTASMTRAPETEVSAGPFKLRSRKQQTLSMIEEEIRAAQEREEELRRQRQSLHTAPSPIKKSGSLPTRLMLAGQTAPGKIEKIRSVPPTSPSSEGPLPSPLSDQGSDESGGSLRPKNFMQTLMEDFESHKVKRREKVEDASVLEATRVTRRKSSMALRWEAGLYANQEEEDE